MTDASEVSMGGETAKSVLAKFSMALTGFVGTIIFARILGPTNFGGYYLLFASVKVVDRPIGGFASAAKKRFSELDTAQDEVLGGQLLVNVVWIVVSSTGALLAREHLRSYTGISNAAVLFVVLLVTVTSYEPLERLVQAQGRIGAASWMDTVRSYLTLPLQLAFVLTGFGAAGMAYGLAGATLLTLPIAFRVIWVKPAVPSRETLAHLFSFAKHSVPTAIVGKAYDRLDLLLLGALIAPAAAGHYEVAAKLTLPATFVAAAAGSGLMARVSNLRSKGEDVAVDVSNTLAFASLLSLPILFGALALSRGLIVTIYGPEYRAAAALLIGLAVYRVLQSQSGPLSHTVAGLDMPEINRNVSIVTLTINLLLGVFLAVSIGPIGVVIATVVAELIRYLTLVITIRRTTPEVQILPRTLLEQLGASLVMFVIVALLHRFVPIRSWLHLVALVGTGAVVYGTVLLGISDRLRLTIGSVLRGSRIEQYVPEQVLRW